MEGGEGGGGRGGDGTEGGGGGGGGLCMSVLAVSQPLKVSESGGASDRCHG